MVRRPPIGITILVLAASLAAIVGYSQVSQAGDEPREELAARLAAGDEGWQGMAFIAGGDRNKVWIVDARFHELVSTFDVDGPFQERTEAFYPNLRDVHAMVFSKDFSVMYTVNWFEYDEPSHVIAYDPRTFEELWRTTAGRGGHHAALTPDDRYLYVANQYADTVSIIDVETGEWVQDIVTGFGNDYITPTMYWDGVVIETPYLFVSVHQGGHDETGTVYVIDWETHEVVESITLGGMVHGINLTPDAAQAWAAVMGVDVVAVIDVETLEVIHLIDFPGSPIHLSFSPDGDFVYLTTSGDQLYKVDAETYEVVWNQTGTSIPAHTGVTPDGRELWTLNHGMDRERYPYLLGGAIVSGVQVWDTETGRLKNEFVAEGTPHEIQFVPYEAIGLMTAEPIDMDEEHAEARTVYNQICFACHGPNLEGASGPGLREVGDRLTRDEILHVIMHGRGSMPGNLVPAHDAERLADWLSQMEGQHQGH
jgi:YVTN family beta-propeller protein